MPYDTEAGSEWSPFDIFKYVFKEHFCIVIQFVPESVAVALISKYSSLTVNPSQIIHTNIGTAFTIMD